jgi:acetyltransferase
MDKFFYAHSVAVVGVSEDPDNLAQGIVNNLLEFGYQGKIFLVGRRPGAAFGLPIFPGLEDLPEPVDLAVILTPASSVPGLVAQCGELGISRVVVESGGFSELGAAGRALEDDIRALLKKYRLRLVGPNGLGLVNTEIGLALPFSHMRPKPRKGHLSIIAQSGGVGMHLLAWMAREGLGLNKFLSLGNKLNVGENEALEYLLQDPGTAAIYLYLEGLQDGRELLLRAQGSGKPVFLHHPNVGPETAAIARSHTASLSSDESVLDAACRQGGILRVRSQGEFLVGAKLADQPPVKGSRLAVLSRSGGEAVITAYACRQWGFELPPLSPSLVKLIEERARSGVIRPTNPIDLGDIFDFSVYSEVAGALCRDPEVDAILINYGPLGEGERDGAREAIREIIATAKEAEKPLAISVVCTLDEEDYLRETLNFPVFHFPGEAVRALAYSRFFARRAAVRLFETPPPRFQAAEVAASLKAAPAGTDFLPLPRALAFTAALGVPTALWQAAADPAAAAAAAARLGWPVVLKLSAPSLVHKTEVGAVLLDLLDEAAVRTGFGRLASLARQHLPPGEPWEVLVMSQAAGGREVLLGARRDRTFGPVVVFGAGGVETEVLEDVSLRVAPISEAEAQAMIAETKAGRILAGVRGLPPGDLKALGRALTALSQVLMQFPQVQEVDLNPVRVFPGQSSVLALDARVRVG